jgi:uncharacterized protein (UPF0276 family)
MKLAINYSNQSAALLRDGHIQLDCFKTPPWPDLIAEAQALRRAVVHFDLRAGGSDLVDVDWATIARLRQETETPYVNLHMEARRADFPGVPTGTTETSHRLCVAEQIAADLEVAAEHFGASSVIAENVPYHGPAERALRPAVEPQVICEALEASDCGLLLDIAHARLSAHHLGMEARDYIAQLPVDRLRELHFSGVHRLGERLQDHLSATQEDWELLAWVLERVRAGVWATPWMLVFEYGGVGPIFAWRSDPAVILEQAPRLYAMLQGL